MAERIDYPESWNPEHRAALDTMFETARRDGLWFYHGGMSGPLWFSPDELQAEQKNGKFVWGAPNWQLRSLHDRIKQMQAQRDALDVEIADLIDRTLRGCR